MKPLLRKGETVRQTLRQESMTDRRPNQFAGPHIPYDAQGRSMIDRIPNPKRSYPLPGSPEELSGIKELGTDAMTRALFLFGPDNAGAAIAALCTALGTLYRMLPPVASFYGSPDKFALACRTMIAETAADDEGSS